MPIRLGQVNQFDRQPFFPEYSFNHGGDIARPRFQPYMKTFWPRGLLK